MAELSLKIKADFDEAQRQFKALAESSEETRAKMEKFTEGFSNEQVDKFIDKQKLAGAAITATKGDVAAMQAQSAAYQREIEKLIKSGLDPQSEAVQKLAKEQKNLEGKIKEATDAQKKQEESSKAQEQAIKNLEKAALAGAAALAAIGAAIIAATQKSAELGDRYAKASRQIGMTAEELQKLEYAAKISGVNDLQSSLQKLNIQMNQVRNGSGALTKALEGSNSAMLAQIKGAKSTDEAYRLVLKAIKEAPDSFKKAEIAQAAFGRSGQDIILMAEEGEDALNALCAEAERYGIISNKQAKASEEYLDAQTRFKAALQGVGNEIAGALIPGFTNLINKAADFIAGINNWEKILKDVALALSIVTAGVTAFLVATKGAAIVQKFTIAIKGFFAAVNSSAGVIGLVAMALTTVIGLMSRYESRNVKQAKQTLANAEAISEQARQANNLVDSFAGLDRSKKLDEETTERLINIYPQLSDALRGTALTADEAATAIKAISENEILTSAQAMIDELMTSGAGFIKAIEKEREKLNDDSLSDRARRRVESDLNSLLNYIGPAVNQVNDILNTIGKEYDTTTWTIVDTAETQMAKVTEALNQASARAAMSMSQLLNNVEMTEQQKMNERINQAVSFFKARADLERAEGDNRIRSIEAEYTRILKLAKLEGNELIALERAKNESIQAIREELAAEEERLRKEREKNTKENEDNITEIIEEALEKRMIFLQNAQKSEEQILSDKKAAYEKLTDSMIDLIFTAAKASNDSFEHQQKMAHAEVAINAGVAVMKAWARASTWVQGVIETAAIGATQMAQHILIAQQKPPPLPSKETGGRFIVPDVTPRVDGVGLRVNPGEIVDVTTRGEAGGGIVPIYITIKAFEQTIFEITNKGLRSGDIHECSPAWNFAR